MSNYLELKLPDGDWTCRWIGDLYYKKDPVQGGIRVESKVSYNTGAAEPLTIRISVYNLFLTIAGSRLRIRYNTVRSFLSNAQYEPKRKVYLVPVSGKVLTDSSTRIYRHLGMSGAAYAQVQNNDLFLRDVVHRLRLPTTFGYSHAHCVPNTNPAYPVDYFLIPSWEVLRFFFLHEGGLARKLLSYFTGQGERITHSMNELFVHPTGKSVIELDGAIKTASLFVTEGLTDPEIHCLARLAFIPEAYQCLEMVRDSLLLNSFENDTFGYGKLQTIFPQNKPFELAVCGQAILWQDKRFLLVDQIYAVKEERPYDRLLYLPLADHRSQAVLSEEARRIRTKKATPKTSRSVPSRLTALTRGNTHQPADLTSFLLTGYSFNDEPEKPIKVEKTGQTARYQTPKLALIAQHLISLEETAQAQADAGRGKLHRRDIVHYTPSERPSITLFEALRRLVGYRCSYFNLDRDTPSFDYHFYLNSHRGLRRPFDVVLCRLEPQDASLKASIYLVWANAIRYALFYAPALRQIPWAVLTDLCNNYLGKDGVYAFGKDGVYGSVLRGHMRAYDRHNQLHKDAATLARKIENELADILDDHTPSIR